MKRRSFFGRLLAAITAPAVVEAIPAAPVAVKAASSGIVALNVATNAPLIHEGAFDIAARDQLSKWMAEMKRQAVAAECRIHGCTPDQLVERYDANTCTRSFHLAA